LSTAISRDGKRRKSTTRATAIVTAVSSPMSEFNLKGDKVRTMNPATKTNVVTVNADPTCLKAYWIAAPASKFCSRLPLKYLLRKWIVSSTTMPSVMLTTGARDRTTYPIINPQMPKAMPIGMRIGSRLMKPILNDLRTITRMVEISMIAMSAPLIMLRVLRCPM